MSLEVRPLGVKCNIKCHYCYQNPQRDADNVTQEYDLDALKASIEAHGQSFTLFGGEALMMGFDDLENLLTWGAGKFGRNSLQTNGVLITDRHVELFRRCKVHVGVSVDGPGDLNAARWAGTDRGTAVATQKTHAAIEKLCAGGVIPSLILTLHRVNASAAALPAMEGWLRRLDAMGVRSVRLHTLEVDDELTRTRFALSKAEQLEAFGFFAKLENTLAHLRFDVFGEMRRLMEGRDNRTTCVWNACDPYTTRAVQGLEADGQRSNCGRTNKDGVDFVKSDQPGFERYLALYKVPQEHGGCQGCRFFLVCKGQCPGTAIDNDWRNRTEHCDLWMKMYGELEQKMLSDGKLPLSLRADRPKIEAAMLRCWSAGHNPMIETLLRLIDKDESAPAEHLARHAMAGR